MVADDFDIEGLMRTIPSLDKGVELLSIDSIPGRECTTLLACYRIATGVHAPVVRPVQVEWSAVPRILRFDTRFELPFVDARDEIQMVSLREVIYAFNMMRRRIGMVEYCIRAQGAHKCVEGAYSNSFMIPRSELFPEHARERVHGLLITLGVNLDGFLKGIADAQQYLTEHLCFTVRHRYYERPSIN